jgi:hypothetical protein
VLETDDPVREQRRNANRHQEERERNRRERERDNGGNNNPLSLRPSQLAALNFTLPIPTIPSSTGTPLPAQTSSNGPNWTTTAATIALITLGAALIIGGLLFTGVGAAMVIYGAAELAGMAVGAEGAIIAGLVAGHTASGIVMGLVGVVGGLAIANQGITAIDKAITP